MMDKTLHDWYYVIRNASVDNTYKMGWCKAIVECCVEDESISEISFDRISEKMFKYYWNQTIFFDLQQSPNPNKPPVFISYAKKLIDKYQEENGFMPIKYERVETMIQIDINKLNGLLKKDVSHRFPRIAGKVYPLYDLDLERERIVLPDPAVLKEYSDLLFEIINYRWSQILENFNSSPRITQKIKITDRGEIRRKPLTKFHKYLSLSDTKCFVCGQELYDEVSIDHVIPWSYMYSDDLWNLVYTHKSCNSSKSNRIVDEAEIDKLEARNQTLVSILESNNITDKHYKELTFSIKRNLPRKFWIGFKG